MHKVWKKGDAMKDCSICKVPQSDRTAKSCCKCLGYNAKGKLTKAPWEPADDTRTVHMSDEWWDNQSSIRTPERRHIKRGYPPDNCKAINLSKAQYNGGGKWTKKVT